MIKQELYIDNSNSGDAHGLYGVLARFKDVLSLYNDKGWGYVNHTITKDDEGDWLLTAVFSQVVEKV